MGNDFHGDNKPDMADLWMYSVIASREYKFDPLLKQFPQIESWKSRMDKLIK
jgi:hypothetical protein